MNCENYSLLLDEYIERELNQEKFRQVDVHLAVCASCKNLYQELLEEQKLYSAYISEFKMSPNLWINIQSEIEEKHKRKSIIQQSIASIFYVPKFRAVFVGIISFFVISVVAFSLFYRLESGKEVGEIRKEVLPTNDFEIQNLPSPSDITNRSGNIKPKIEQKRTVKIDFVSPQKVSFQKQTKNPLKAKKGFPTLGQPQLNKEVIRAENEFLKAIAILSREVAQKQQKLSAAGKSKFNRSLGVLNKTIAETRRAVSRQPNDPIAIQYMSAAYSKKVELLRMIAE